MVYYGSLSKGCERCRQRKIKCDQRKPNCAKCQKAKTQCPGYRNLSDVMFRDESPRIIRNSRTGHEQAHYGQLISSHIQGAVKQSSYSNRQQTVCVNAPDTLPSGLLQSDVPWGPNLAVNELGAHFFFANFTCNKPPFSESYHRWLTKVYFDGQSDLPLRAVIEAAGMAGISNRFYAPEIALKARENYARALASTKHALEKPFTLIADTTLLAVILLGLYEFITCDSWENYRSWATHVNGATTLLQLRGQKQFDNERGQQLFLQLRSQFLLAWMQQDVALPESLVEIARELHDDDWKEKHRNIRLSQLGDMSYRLLDLRSAIQNGEITSQRVILETGMELDRDLTDWSKSNERKGYITVDAAGGQMNFSGKRHIYADLADAQAWNNWRALRILVVRLIREAESMLDIADTTVSMHVSKIASLSTDICISTSSFSGSSRAATLIWPLLIVASQSSNPRPELNWAIAQLRHINATMGIRQASFLADTVEKKLEAALSKELLSD